MTDVVDQNRERRRAALTTLGTVGAAVAGAGIGALLAPTLLPFAWAIVAVGVISHLVGMVGLRSLLASAGYRAPAWQRLGYWLCWAAIAVVLLYAIMEAVR
jgi:hypothetical protein